MASISCRHVKKVYPGNVVAVPDFSLEIADKEFIVFVGPSGCGKSTTLRMIAGLEEISGGEMYIGDRLINDVPPKDRDIAMVFQNYALYPHMTVYKNMAFGLELRKMPKDEIDKRVREAAKILEIEHLLDRKPKALSGGQRQRVALGRAMVRNPAVDLVLGHLAQLQGEGHVVIHRHVGVEGVALEDHGDVPVLGLYVVDLPLVDVQLPLGDVLQSGHHPQGGGLAAAGGTHQHDKLLVRNLQIEVVHCGHISIIDLKNMLQTDC